MKDKIFNALYVLLFSNGAPHNTYVQFNVER